MKKGFFVPFSLIYLLSNNNILDGMTKTRQVSKAIKPKNHSIQKTIYQTKTYQKPLILFDRLKLYYNQAKQRFSQFWYGKKYPQTIIDEKVTLLNDIHNKKSRALQSFETFLTDNNQDSINDLLNKIVFSNQDIDFLNEKVFALLFGISLGNKGNIKIANKIITWAQENIIRIFTQDFPITDKFFIISLLNINAKLIPAIHDHLDYIQEQPIGKQFLNILKTEHQAIYNAVMQRKQPIKQILEEGIQKSLEELRTKK